MNRRYRCYSPEEIYKPETPIIKTSSSEESEEPNFSKYIVPKEIKPVFVIHKDGTMSQIYIQDEAANYISSNAPSKLFMTLKEKRQYGKASPQFLTVPLTKLSS